MHFSSSFFPRRNSHGTASDDINRCTSPNRENALEAIGLFTEQSERHERRKAPNTSQLIQINHSTSSSQWNCFLSPSRWLLIPLQHLLFYFCLVSYAHEYMIFFLCETLQSFARLKFTDTFLKNVKSRERAKSEWS